jgi:hypothetical protein
MDDPAYGPLGCVGATVALSPRGWQCNCHPNHTLKEPDQWAMMSSNTTIPC